MPFGFNQGQWDQAVEEARRILRDRASQRSNQTISYSELASLIRTISFGPQDKAFHSLLGDVSVAENKIGKGMLSVLVVHKGGDQMPGAGFFDLAEELGREIEDDLQFWSEEFARVLASNSRT